MKYSTSLRQYVITESGVLHFTGLNITEGFDSPREIEAFLIECSDDVYNYVYSLSTPRTIEFKRYQIAKDDDVREEFKRALIYQVRYAYRSGAHLVKDQHGVNIERSKFTPINVLRNDIGIAKATKDVLLRTGLLYTGYLYINIDADDEGTY
jgi:hypothetical protein